MVTNDERRDVAAKLRFNALAASHMNTSDDFAREVFRATMSEVIGNYQDAINRLADLIEPESERTCRVESSHEEEGDGCYSYFKYELSCGHEVKSECQLPPSYCPECGKKVLYDTGKYL